MKGYNMAKTVDMTKGSPVRLLLQFSIPIPIGNLFQQAYTLADRIIVGRFVGDTAFSAIGATNALSMMFIHVHGRGNRNRCCGITVFRCKG